MSISVIHQNLLTVERGIIVHQVNTLGRMGKGLAQTLRTAYPAIYDSYKACIQNTEPNRLLGTVDYVTVKPNLLIAQVFGQASIQSPRKPKTNHTDEQALEQGLSDIRAIAELDGLTIHIPRHIGSGLAGGDKTRIHAIIERVFEDCIVPVWLYDYDGNTKPNGPNELIEPIEPKPSTEPTEPVEPIEPAESRPYVTSFFDL